ncbi:uncharacterized protein TRAVEDRAFT_74756 [Trametes versicolor FP-101664 SS1]|uniref:uncharacterized protein n=1 Tax=Trametes versicolor (strain FP-101664) TaxID=717944 RepID=UPI00046241C6|nr:uncharacterized protein TRAVEDRAFT_74756 [Trametes versicolor FP-101664 SS1]EIW53427.1 hypothetical protein TRAVEDRAFT_74756 [Trametes versicolor FP-101664 SS1]
MSESYSNHLCVHQYPRTLNLPICGYRVTPEIVHRHPDTDAEVRAVVDGQHYVKTGPLDLIVWEYMVYSQLQLEGDFPLICERLVDCGSGSRKAALLLHRVSTFSVLFKNYVAQGSPPIPYDFTAWCAKSLIILMQKMHSNNVLHCDIHPGNAGLTPCDSLGVLVAPLTADTAESTHPTFIDFGWSQMGGFHPRGGDDNSVVCWAYASDRMLDHGYPYTRADDMAALAYLLLAVRLMGHPPWFDELLSQDLSEDREAIIATRARVIGEFRAQKTVEDHLLDFVSYATSLAAEDPELFIDYHSCGILLYVGF